MAILPPLVSMPKLLLVASLALVALSLSGCGDAKKEAVTSTTTTTTRVSPGPTPAPPAPAPASSGCICIFDVDRTLTAIQTELVNASYQPDDCSDALAKPGVFDSAYNGGTLRLSALARDLNTTFCSKCYHGVVSSGEMSGYNSSERKIILEVLGGLSKTLNDHWADTEPFSPATSQSLLAGYPATKKESGVATVVSWMRKQLEGKVEIKDEDVWFFDDRADTIDQFKGSAFNAIQVSCASRDRKQGHIVGFCGATAAEVDKAKAGVHVCETGLVGRSQAATEAIAV